MDPQLITLAGLFCAVAPGGGGVVWKLTRVESGIREKIESETDVLNEKLAKVHERLAGVEKQQIEEIAILRREAGESIAAIRTKVHEIETWARDEFVRKGSFETVVSRMEKGIENLGEKIERRLDKMAERIEKITHDK
jgi:uncharacterized protein YPO0396